MSRGIKKSLIALSVSGVLFTPSAFATNGYFGHGYSTAEKGLAGAGVAHSQDVMSIANNPAGVAGMGNRMDVGAAFFAPSRSYNTTGGPSAGCAAPGQCTFSIGPNDIESSMTGFLIPHFGYNWSLDDKSSVALAFYGNGGMNTNYNGGTATFSTDGTNSGFVSPPGTYGAGTAGVDLKQLFTNVTYATKLNDKHSVGASLIMAYQTFESKGLDTLAGFSSNPAALSGNDADSSTGFGIKLGWQGEISKSISLGVTYQSEMSMSEFDDYSGLFAESGDFDIPATASIGLAWKTSKSSTLVVDVQSIFYSDVASLANGISPLTTGGCAPGPTGGTGDGCLGGPAGAGFGWEDMTVVKVGYEWGNDTIWRVGVSNGSQPIPDTELLFNILAPGVIETHITGGFTMSLGSDSEISFAAMYALNNSVSGASPFDPAQTIEIEMDQIEIQGTYTMKF